MSIDKQKQQVLDVIDTMRDRIVRTVSDLVKIRSVNPGYPGVDYDQEIGGETKVNNYLAARYREMGLEVDLWEVEENRANLVAVWKGTAAENR